MSRFLIVGTGSSGTTYCHAILNICGIRCGHQDVFKHENVLSGEWDWKNFDGDSSFEAVPLLMKVKEKEPETKIIGVIRNPFLVTASLVEKGLFVDDMRERFIFFSEVLDRIYPEVLAQKSQAERISLFIKTWVHEISKYSDYIFEIETMKNEQLFESIGYGNMYKPVLVNSVSKKINSAFS